MSTNKPSTSKESQPIQEYCIRFTPKTNKKYNVMRFNESDGINFANWKKVKLERDFNIKEFKASEDQPKFGAGSVFGAEQREENRKKRYQKYVSRHRPEDHPYILSVKLNKTATQPQPITNTVNKQSSVRRFKGVREGGVTDNTSYYVFFQAHDGAFEAFPVSEWYKFTPIPKFKALTAEEAEEKFIKRDKMLNFFSVMDNKNKKELNDTMDDEFKPRRSRKEFKTSDMDDWNDFGGSSDGSDSDNDTKTKKKGKKDSDDDFDSEAKEESDEGDFDTREVDYMSDLSSDEDEELAERINEQLKGVEDEDGLRQLALTDDEEEENKPKEENDKKEDVKSQNDKLTPNKKPVNDIKIKQEKKDDSSDTSDSDFDDDYKLQSPIFMQKVDIKKEATEQTVNNNLKRKLETSTDSINQATTSNVASVSASQVKRPKVTNNNPEQQLEEAVKRYLLRKPTSAIELIKNLRKMKIISSKEQLVKYISQILKKLNAQEKEISGKKYYYLDPKNFK